MRLLMAVLLLSPALPPAQASVAKDQCKLRCSQETQTCLKRARTKKARKSCSVSRKTCTHGCSGR